MEDDWNRPPSPISSKALAEFDAPRKPKKKKIIKLKPAIVFCGISSSGKSTIAERFSECTDFPVLALDDIDLGSEVEDEPEDAVILKPFFDVVEKRRKLNDCSIYDFPVDSRETYTLIRENKSMVQPITFIWIEVSFDDFINQVKSRNTSEDIAEHRTLYQSLDQYMQTHVPTRVVDDKRESGVLKFESVKSILKDSEIAQRNSQTCEPLFDMYCEKFFGMPKEISSQQKEAFVTQMVQENRRISVALDFELEPDIVIFNQYHKNPVEKNRVINRIMEIILEELRRKNVDFPLPLHCPQVHDNSAQIQSDRVIATAAPSASATAIAGSVTVPPSVPLHN